MLSQIKNAIRAAEREGPVPGTPRIEGLSGDRLVGCLQRLAALNPLHCYVEIGVYRGLTLTSVGHAARDVAVFGIDNFSQFDPDGRNRSIVLQQLATHRLDNVSLIDSDFEVALERLQEHLRGASVGTFFVDGPHDYRSQLMCLELMWPHLAPSAVIVVDDSNYRHVRQANRDFLAIHPEYRLLFEAYTPCHPNYMDEQQMRDARQGWWNGVNIMVHDANGELAREFPTVDPTHQSFIHDHVVHSSSVAARADLAVNTIAQLLALKPLKALRGLLSLAKWRWRERAALAGVEVGTNTFSATLPRARFNGEEPESGRCLAQQGDLHRSEPMR